MKNTTPKTVAEMAPNPKNPRKITDKQLAALKKSLEKFGDLSGFIYNTRSSKLVGGHQRAKALADTEYKIIWAQRLPKTNAQGTVGYGHVAYGDERLTCRMVDWPEKIEKAAMIAANKHGGDWDDDLLTDMIAEFKLDPDFDIELLGFDDKELKRFVVFHSSDPADDVPPEPEIKSLTRPGDLFEMISEDGQRAHRLLCGDSTSPEAVKVLVGDFAPVLMVTDPPYGVEYDPDWRNKAVRDTGAPFGARAIGKVENDDKIDWSAAFALLGAPVAYVWHAGRMGREVSEGLLATGYDIIAQIIWAKQHFAISRGDYHWQHEPCFYAVKKGLKHNWQGARDQSTLWAIKNNNKFGNAEAEETQGHGTQKPIECMARPIRNNSGEGDLVVDPFVGSGTTIMAAEINKRFCYAMEIMPVYVDVCIKRFVKKWPRAKVLKNGQPFTA